MARIAAGTKAARQLAARKSRCDVLTQPASDELKDWNRAVDNRKKARHARRIEAASDLNRQLKELSPKDAAELQRFHEYLNDSATMPRDELHAKYADFLGLGS